MFLKHDDWKGLEMMEFAHSFPSLAAFLFMAEEVLLSLDLHIHLTLRSPVLHLVNSHIPVEDEARRKIICAFSFFFFFSLSSSQVYVKAEWIFSFLACWFPSYCCFPVAPAGLHWGAELGTAHTHTHEKRLLCPPEGTRSKVIFPVSGGIMAQNWNLRWMLEFLLNVSVDCPLMVCIWFLKLVSYLLSPVPCIFLPATGRQRFTLILKPQTATNKHTAAYT